MESKQNSEYIAHAKELETYNREKAQGEALLSLVDGVETAKVTPAILPTDIPKQREFSTIRQGNATNTMTKLRAVLGENTTIDDVTGDAHITKGNFTLTIPKYMELNGLKTTTSQLFDIITIACTESGSKSPTVIIPLSTYMELRGLKDRKEAKNQVKNDMEILRRASITGEEKKGKNTQRYKFINIADSGEVRRNGDIVFTYSSTFYNMLLGCPVMPYPNDLLKYNNKKNPNSYNLLRKITEHKNMNIGKKNEDIISVKTLLNEAVNLPSYEEVMASNRNVTDRIIAPFERDMDACSNTITWNYCHRNNAPLTDKELNNMNYETFKELLVKINWVNYPDQTARLEAKAKKIRRKQKKKKD